MQNGGYPLDTLDFRYLVKMYLDKLGIIHKRFNDNFPEPDFVQSFLLRHKNEISRRVCENIKRVRAKVSPDTIKEYFIELEDCLNGVSASNILNYEKTNLMDDHRRKKILIKRGCKYPERVMSHTKAVFIMMAGTADGKMLPPYVVYAWQPIYMILGFNIARRVLAITGRHLDGLMVPLLRIGCKIW